MTLEPYEVIAHSDDGDRDAVTGTQHAQSLGRSKDLIAIHMKDPKGVCRRRHPWLCQLDPRLFDSNLPAGRSPGNLTAEGVADHLGAKADAHQLASFPIEPADQIGKSLYP